MDMKAVVIWSLVAIAQAVHQMTAQRTQRADACACKSFAAVYYDNEAYCGRGPELYFLSKHGFSGAYAATEPIAGEPHRVCYDFFKNFDDASCLNMDLYPFPTNSSRSKNGVQWCYVSGDCTELNGGEFGTNKQGFAQGAWGNLKSGTALPWKICSGSDAMLKSKPVQEVIDLGKKQDIPMHTLMRLAYPAVSIDWGRASYFYQELNAQWTAGADMATSVAAIEQPTGWGELIENAYNELRSIATSGQGTVLDSPGHGDNFYVVQGRAVYSVKRQSDPVGNMAYMSGHFSMEHEVECVMGCAQVERREALDLDTM